MALTDAEKQTIRMHLGYLGTGLAGSIHLGIPAAGQHAHLVEFAFENLLPASEPLVRRAVAECDCIFEQISRARVNLATESVAEVKFRGPGELMELESQYDFWTSNLSDILGAPKNPYSALHRRVSQTPTVIEPI